MDVHGCAYAQWWLGNRCFCFNVGKRMRFWYLVPTFRKNMMNQELLRIVDNIARDKNIDKESIFADLEEAMVSAARKHFAEPESDIVVSINRGTGEITAYKDDVQIDIQQLGRIPAQTAKQVIIQKIRADERNSIYAEFVQRKGEMVSA